MIVNREVTIVSLLFATLVCVTPSQAQEIEIEAEPEIETRTCIPTRSIRRIRVIDDRNVLIYMSARKIYHNVLKNTCGGLKRIGTFSYSSRDGQLCQGDGIAGLAGAWEDVPPIPKCWLGIHHRISKEQADAMRDASKRQPKIPAAPLPMPEPGEVGSENEDPES
ncbi:MAG: hypothetical protein ACR2Q3_17480 [Woeseiaceae bacterium]